jgi:hypothetical protein
VPLVMPEGHTIDDSDDEDEPEDDEEGAHGGGGGADHLGKMETSDHR